VRQVQQRFDWNLTPPFFFKEIAMLDDTLQSQLQTYLGMLRQPICLIASLDDSETGVEMRKLLDTIVSLSDKVSLDTGGSDARKPSFVVARAGETQGVRFAGLPLGHEFTSLVLALLWTGGHPPKVEQDVLEAIKALDGDFAGALDAVGRRSLLVQSRPRGVDHRQQRIRLPGWHCPRYRRTFQHHRP
jgi:hypothetical protein